MLRDVPLERIDPEGSDACRIVSPHVIPGNVERAPVGIEPVAGDELTEGDHIAPSQVEGLRTGLPGDTSSRRGDDPAIVDPVTRQVTLHGQDCECVGLAVTGENRVDELVAAPEQLLFFALNRPRIFFPVKVRSRAPGPGQAAMQPLDHDIQLIRRLVDDSFDGGSIGQLGSFLRPVLGEEADQAIGQSRLHLREKGSE